MLILAMIALLAVAALLAVTTIRVRRREEREPFLRVCIILPSRSILWQWPKKGIR